MSSFSERLATARKKVGLTQTELAEKLELKSGKQVIYKWEKGDGEPNLTQLTRLSKTLGVTVSWLVSDVYDPNLDPEPTVPTAPPGFVVLPADEVIRMQRELLQLRQEGGNRE